MSYIVEIRNLTKSFGEKTALDNMDLEVNSGEILALLGPNGSGKSTLLRILALIQEPTIGEIYFHHEKVTSKNIEKIRLESTMVFQKAVLFNTTVYNNVAYGLRIRKTPRKEIDERVSEALELVKLENFENRHATKLSGGEQQRVALARALALSTKLLLLDEPTANLDHKNASIVEEVIATANCELKTTVVMATHNMFQAKSLPSRIALMERGKITEIGSPAEIFGRLSKTLASFAAVDNVFIGTAKTTKDGTTQVDVGNNIHLETTGQHSGGISVFINPEDIILSIKRFDSSARNIFKGKIVEILDSDSLVKLRIDVGRSFMVQVTKRSFNEMGINLNSEVFLTFKASSVQIV